MAKIIENILIFEMATFLLFITTVELYAFVYDVEPVSPAKEYCLEKEVFDRTNDNWARDFPSFAEWVSQKESSEERFHDWVRDIAREIGEQAAYSLDPWYGIEHSGERDSSCRE